MTQSPNVRLLTEAAAKTGYAGRQSALAPTDPNLPSASRTVVSTFQTGHGFTGGTDDTSTFVMGTQSAKIVTNGTGGQATLNKSGITPTVDMTGKIAAVLVKVDDISKIARLTVGLRSGDGAYQQHVISSAAVMGQELIRSGEWMWISLPWSNAGSYGTTNTRTAINGWFVQAQDSNSGPVTVWVQALAYQPERALAYPNGVVTLCTDDNYGSVKTLLEPMVSKYGFPVTHYVIVDLVDTPGRLTLQQLKDLEVYQGHEIAAHAYSANDHNTASGFNGLSESALDADLSALKDWMKLNAFRGRDHLAYPQGFFNATVEKVAARYFRTARTVSQRNPETLPAVAHPLRIRAQGLTKDSTFAQIQSQIDAAYTNGSWLVIYMHNLVTGTPASSTDVPSSVVQQIVDYLATKGIPVRSIGDVTNDIANNSSSVAYDTDGVPYLV